MQVETRPNFKPYHLDNRYVPNPETGAIWSEISKRYLKGIPTKEGYLRVKIKGKCQYIHRIIAETYLKNPKKKPMVHHKNNVVNDNRLCNLMYVTEQENSDFKYQFGTVTRRRKINIPPNAIFTGFYYQDHEFPTLTALASSVGIANSTASTWFMEGRINYTINHEVILSNLRYEPVKKESSKKIHHNNVHSKNPLPVQRPVARLYPTPDVSRNASAGRI
jgi:hypothetical protein